MSKTHYYLKVELKEFTESEVDEVKKTIEDIVKNCVFDLVKPIEVKKVCVTSSEIK
jgi:hypothetical protein